VRGSVKIGQCIFNEIVRMDDHLGARRCGVCKRCPPRWRAGTRMHNIIVISLIGGMAPDFFGRAGVSSFGHWRCW
jgi:hypothetical protein